jgi:hypothetical protein
MNLDRLGKVWALTRSANAGEAAAARERARIMVEREGKTLADIPSLLRGKPIPTDAPRPSPSGFTPTDMSNPAHRRPETPAEKKRRAERSRKEKPARDDVLRRHGGIDGVLAWTEKERLLRLAVAPWSVFQPPPHQRWTKSIDGHEVTTPGPPPARVVRALSDAYPLPRTISEAAGEYGMWQSRDRDVGLAVEASDNPQLDLSAEIRRDIVRRLMEVDLRAQSVAEVLIRQRHLVEMDTIGDPDIEKAVLLDLESLDAAGQRTRAAEAAAAKPERARATEPPPAAPKTAAPPPKPQAKRAKARPIKPVQPDMFG